MTVVQFLVLVHAFYGSVGGTFLSTTLATSITGWKEQCGLSVITIINLIYKINRYDRLVL